VRHKGNVRNKRVTTVCNNASFVVNMVTLRQGGKINAGRE